jgi:hypothetical protein
MARRSVFAVFLAAAVAILVASTAFAGKPSTSSVPAGSGCKGIRNAYAHAAPAAQPALQRVAEKHGCDLTGVQPAVKPGNSDSDDADEDSDASEADDDAGAGPDVAAKCAKINEKLAQAALRTHGKSAAAYARQAQHWGCAPA